MQETWLPENSDVSLYQLENYNMISQGKICSNRGGLVIYLRDTFEYKQLSIYDKSDIWEGQFIEINKGSLHKTIVLGNIYRPPRNLNENYETFTTEFSIILQNLQKSKHEVVIGGDFNIDLLNIHNKPTFSSYFDTITSIGFYPQITLPTRLSQRRGTIIDNFLLKLSCTTNNHASSGIFTSRISDHFPYFTCLNDIQIIEPTPKYIKTRPRRQDSLNKFKNEISNANLYEKLQRDPDSNPNDNYNIIHETICEAIEKHLPSKNVKYNKHKHKKSSWITQGIVKSISFRDNLYRKMKMTPVHTEEHHYLKSNLKIYNKILNTNIRLAKKSYYNYCFQKYKNDMRNTWSTINSILNRTKKKRNFPDSFNINGDFVSDKVNIANQFNIFFTNIGPKLASKIKYSGNGTFRDYLNTPTQQRFAFQHITDDYIAKIIDSLKPKSSCGFDGLSTKLLKLIKSDICKPINLILNQSINTGIFPDYLKIAKVIPIHKKDDDTLFDNYRPISILPAISKIFERVMFNQLHEYFKLHKLYYDSQYGFREQHSTELASLELIDRLLMEMDKGETPLNIYMDLSKAFDTLDHNILLEKLLYYGIQGSALELFKSYFKNRKQFVELEDTKSNLTEITTGVPQGSILGPLLFIIYINDLTSASTLFKPIIYADDTTLFTTLTTMENSNLTRDLSHNINNELTKVCEWLQINKLSLNAKKTKFMVFHKPQKKIIIPTLEINGNKLDSVDEFCFLGIVFDKHLSWNNHVGKISCKISQTTGVINKLKHFLPSNILQTIYNSLILPHLNYGILAWGHKNDRLFKLQKRVIRIISHSNFRAHTEPIFKFMKILKLEDLYQLQQLKFYYKLVNNRLPFYFSQIPFHPTSHIHNYDTRSPNNNLYKTRVRHEFAKKCIRHKIVESINNTPDIIRSKLHTHSLYGFSLYIKNYFINRYEEYCTLINCYVCNDT